MYSLSLSLVYLQYHSFSFLRDRKLSTKVLFYGKMGETDANTF